MSHSQISFYHRLNSTTINIIKTIPRWRVRSASQNYAMLWWTLHHHQHGQGTFYSNSQPPQFPEYFSNLSYFQNSTLHWIQHLLIFLMMVSRTKPHNHRRWWWRIFHWENSWHTTTWMWILISCLMAWLWPRAQQMVTRFWITRLWSPGQLGGLMRWISLILSRFYLILASQ